MKVEKFDYNSLDELLSNTYIVYEGNEAIIVDPGKEYQGIVNFLNKNELSPVAIFLTHGHFDHIGGVKTLLEAFPSLDVYIEANDIEVASNPDINCSDFCDVKVSLDIDFKIIKDKDVIHLLNTDIKVIHTPFHTMGSVCYYFKNNNWLFTGDTLFMHGIGRYDLPTSSPRLISSSLGKLKELPKDTKVFPGHGPNTTIGNEFVGLA